MIDLAVKVGYVQADQVEKLKEWRLVLRLINKLKELLSC